MPTVWPDWVNQGTGGTLANTWNVWVNTGSAATTPQTGTQAPWNVWLNQPTAGVYQPTIWLNWQNTEELANRDRARHALIWQNRNRARKLRRKFAERRAEALLLEHLSEAQRAEWVAERAFTVHTGDGKRAYRIAYGLAGNVRLVKAEEPPVGKSGHPLRPGARFCMHVYHPDGWVPNEDNVLAQKLLIESNEEHFLALANAW